MRERLTGFLAGAGHKLELFFLACCSVGDALRQHRSVLRQTFRFAAGGAFTAVLAGFFSSMSLMLTVGNFGLQSIAAGGLGPTFLRLMTTETAPLVAALALVLGAGRGALTAVEGFPGATGPGTSRDLARVVVLPNLLALALACPLLYGICNAVGAVGWLFTVGAQSGDGPVRALVSAGAPWTWTELEPTVRLVGIGFGKSAVFGAAVAVVLCGDAVSEGRTSHRSTRNALISVIVANYFLSWFALYVR